MKVNHTAFVVADIEEAIKALEGLGFHVTSEPTYVPFGGVKKAFMENEHGEGAELLSPVDENSGTHELLRQRIGTFHICMETENIDKTIADLAPLGYKAQVVRFAKGFGRRACFMDHPILGSVQFLEYPPEEKEGK